MNPWFGVIAGPAFVVLGIMVLRDPRRFAHFSDLGFRTVYRARGAPYEGSVAERFTLATGRIGGVISLLFGVGVFVGGLVDLANG